FMGILIFMDTIQKTSMMNNLDIFKEAWVLLKGFKWKFWLAVGVMVIVSYLIGTTFMWLGRFLPQPSQSFLKALQINSQIPSEFSWSVWCTAIIFTLVSYLLLTFISLPMYLGLSMMSIQRARSEPIPIIWIFSNFS